MTHFLRFLVVGTIGFIINTLGLLFGVRLGLKPSMAGPAGAELAIISNFILNNYWTFADKSITSWDQIPGKFLAFNLVSLGSVIIQFLFLKSGEKLVGLDQFKQPALNLPFVSNLISKLPLLKPILVIPLIAKLAQKITLYLIFYVAGVAVGLVVNFILYSQVIWR